MNPQADAQAQLRRGYALFEAHDLDGALAAYSEALRLDPGLAAAHVQRGLVRREQNDLDGAAADFEAAQRRAPDDRRLWGLRRELYRERGKAYFRSFELEKALHDFNRAFALGPPDAADLVQRGTTHLLNGDGDEALADFEAALELDPDNADALTRRAVLRSLPDGDASAAWTDVEEALARDPDNLQALLIRGTVRLEMGLRTEGLEDYDAVLARSPGHPAALLGRWQVHFEDEQYDLALENCETLLRLDPEHAMAYLLRGMTREALGEPVEALGDLERATELNPDLADIVLGDLQAGRVTQLTPKLMRALRKEFLRQAPPF